MPPSQAAVRQHVRELHILSHPVLWPTWPFLPVIRRQVEQVELGLLFDALAVCHLPGYRCTVFRANLFALPRRLEDFLSLPREVFDTFEELVAAGWHID
jgi:hypothetical protein